MFNEYQTSNYHDKGWALTMDDNGHFFEDWAFVEILCTHKIL